ncbi:MAG TPA: hypothetical protein VLA60_07830, partial [Nitrospirales bacterium]|nr:hypothetical protein [Nitrospirales bacterium]
MRRFTVFSLMFIMLGLGFALVVPIGQAADAAKEMAAKYILATSKAARTVYVKGIMADATKGGMKPNE